MSSDEYRWHPRPPNQRERTGAFIYLAAALLAWSSEYAAAAIDIQGNLALFAAQGPSPVSPAPTNRLESKVAATAPSETPVSQDDIARAARDYYLILQKGGLIGAHVYSRACHRAVLLKPSWSAADRCAAFDYAASAENEAWTKALGRHPDGYFAFEKDNQADNYQVLGTLPYNVNQRLQQIKKVAESAAHEVMSGRVAQTEAAHHAKKAAPLTNAEGATPESLRYSNVQDY
jgi:hypothetical protein